MSTAADELLGAFECHDVEAIRALLDSGVDPLAPINGKLPIHHLTEMYLRSERFPACLQLLLERGAKFDDPAIEPVLLNDADAVSKKIRSNPEYVHRRTTMISAFTPLVGVTPLHVAAEFGNAKAARALIENGADVNARAAVDEFGLNGHTPLFHTVNSILDYSEPVMRLLLAAGADVNIRLAGIVWGKGFEWETTFFDVTPISFAQVGLMPQVHRQETQIYANIRRLLVAGNRPIPPLDNIPNRYLRPKNEGFQS